MSKKDFELLGISWEKNTLRISGPGLPEGGLKVWYIEAFCRPESRDRDWKETVIPHETRVVSEDRERGTLQLESSLDDGVIVRHLIRTGPDQVSFELEAFNPTDEESQAHWAVPCIHVADFTGFPEEHGSTDYLSKCFVFLDGKLERMPTRDWATEARLSGGQVWKPASVPIDDVNPRPLNPNTPSNGLIGCFSADEKMILATAWEPYQELFQGVLTCLHSNFRIGGLMPGETKRIRGKIYIVPNDIPALLARYSKDFPEH